METSVWGKGRPTVSQTSSGLSSALDWVITGQASVCPYTVWKSHPYSWRTRRTSSGCTIDPPLMASFTEETSRRCAAWASSMAVSMVGTHMRVSTRSASMRAFILEPSNCRARMMRQPNCTGPRVLMEQPAVWNIGMQFSTVQSGVISPRSKIRRALLVRPRWVNTAPLGKPVVPEVYWIWAGSSGPTAGRAATGEGWANSASGSVMSTTSRRAGSSAATLAAICAMGLPRCSGVRNSPTERDWRSTKSSSRAW